MAARAWRIARLARPYRAPLTAAFGLSLLGLVGALAFPLGLRSLLDAVVGRGDRAMLHRVAAALVTLYVVRAAMNYASSRILQTAGERVVADLRERAYAHLHTLDARFFTRHQTGDLMARLTSDVAAVRNVLIDCAPSLLLQALQLAGAVALMMRLNWRLSLLALPLAPLATLLSAHLGPRLRVVSRDMQERLGAATAVAQEGLTNMRLVQSFARGRHETVRYRHALNDLLVSARGAIALGALFGSLVEAMFMIAVVTIFWYGGTEVLAGRLSPGSLVAFLFFAQTISSSVGQVTRLYGALNSAAGASERIFELLDTVPEVRDAAGAVPVPKPAWGEIRLERVSFAYEPGRAVLHDVSLTIRPGETVAVVGASGAGKTTLLHLIPRFYDASAGAVLLDGRDVRAYTLTSLRESVAIVSQDVQLFGGTVRDNIRYGRLDADACDVEAAARAANAHAFISALPEGYDTIIGEGGATLSGGQRQRIAIARAVLKNAPVLLLDEATSAVDGAAEAAIKDALARLRVGRTTVIVAHRLSTVRNADRVVVLEAGRIREQGSPAELMRRNGIYAAMIAQAAGSAATLSGAGVGGSAPSRSVAAGA